MDLGSVLSRVSEKLSGETHHNDNYLAVKISTRSVLAAIWAITDGKVTIGQVGSGDVETNDWEGLLKAADQAVSIAIPGESTTSAKTIFAVPFDWVANGKIDPSHLTDLRRLCKELDLSPQGFVVTSEALANFYKETEGAPLTAILIGVEGQNGFLTTYRAGLNLGTTVFGWSDDGIAPAVEKVLKGLTHMEVLPSRIIIYDGKSDLEEIAQKLTAHPWTKQLPFLHFPKVEIIPSESAVKAVAVAGGVEMGGKFELAAEDRVSPPPVVATPEPPVVPKENEPEPTPEPVPESPLELEEVSLEEAGFSTSDVLPAEPVVAPQTEETVVPEAVATKPTFGQIRDLQSSAPAPVAPGKSKPSVNLVGALAAVQSWSKTAAGKIRPVLSRIKLPGKLGAGNRLHFRATFIALPIIVLVVLAIILYSVPKVTAIVKVTPKPFDKEAEVLVTTDSAKLGASSSATLLGSFIDVSEIGTKKGVASGKKLVGDKARGSVTVYGVSTAKTFPAGTALSSTDGLKITLDHDVSIASGDAITPATITTTVTASAIGDNYNFPSGTKFTIAGLPSSQYLAKNDSALTGGNSHQATVVTKDDQDRLMATLSAELAEKAKLDLESQVPPGQNLLPNAMTTTISQKKFSKDVDAEADTVSLDLTVDYRGVVFPQSDLVAIFAEKFSAEIPSGYALPPDLTRIEVKSAKNDKLGNSILQIHLTGQVLPVINKTTLINQISGKSLSQATTTIKLLPSVSAVTIDTSPRVLGFVSNFFLPFKKENIKVDIISE